MSGAGLHPGVTAPSWLTNGRLRLLLPATEFCFYPAPGSSSILHVSGKGLSTHPVVCDKGHGAIPEGSLSVRPEVPSLLLTKRLPTPSAVPQAHGPDPSARLGYGKSLSEIKRLFLPRLHLLPLAIHTTSRRSSKMVAHVMSFPCLKPFAVFPSLLDRPPECPIPPPGLRVRRPARSPHPSQTPLLMAGGALGPSSPFLPLGHIPCCSLRTSSFSS